MYFVRKKDLRIVGEITAHIVQFQLEDYLENIKIRIKEWEKITKLEKL